MRFMRNFLVIAVLLLVSSSFAQSQILYGAATGNSGPGSGDAPSSLYIINPNTGASNLIGPIGFNGVTGLEILPDGRLIASANMDEGDGMGGASVAVLIEIDKGTGAGTLIGELGRGDVEGECGRMPDISYDSNTGTLFGYSDQCGGGDDELEMLDARFINYEGLYIINPNNANVNFIGPSGFQDGGNGMAVRPSDGTIFHVPNDANGGLVILNRNTGQGTIIPGSEGNVPLKIGALDFNSNGLLYGALKPDKKKEKGPKELALNETEVDSLVIINQNNGITTVVGPSVQGLDAIVFAQGVSQVPTLSEYALIGTVLLLLAGSVLVLRRRQKLSV
jgi:hypothetical protein